MNSQNCSVDMHTAGTKGRAFLLTSYMTGATRGKNLGTPGYSYDIVAQCFAKLLANHGEVVPVSSPIYNLEFATAAAREKGLVPFHISFMPFQDLVICKSAPNIVVPSWEFPDIPNHVFDDNEKNDWPTVAKDVDLVIVGGSFTKNSLRKGGIECPIEKIQVPTPQEYFAIADWNCNLEIVIPCRAYFPKKTEVQVEVVEFNATRASKLRNARICARNAVSNVLNVFHELYMAAVGPSRCEVISEWIRKRRIERRRKKQELKLASGRSSLPTSLRDKLHEESHKVMPPSTTPAQPQVAVEPIELDYASTPELRLSGIVYTSIFNPDDGRKNWLDLLNAFLITFCDRTDVTLVMKLVTRKKESIEQFIQYYLDRDIPHRCKVAIVVDFLTDDNLQKLCQASTYYYQTTRAEGNCLPLMNHLAAGRPGISPDHSAMGDYFDSEIGFVISSTREPAAWPHDSKHRLRSSWGRLNWESCCQQLHASYDLAVNRPAEYKQMSVRCRSRMQDFASIESAAIGFERVVAILDQLAEQTDQSPVILDFCDAQRKSQETRSHDRARAA